jgi:cytoskeletal protein CcmA (bactofilin family)
MAPSKKVGRDLVVTRHWANPGKRANAGKRESALSYFSQTKGERDMKSTESTAVETRPEAPVRKPAQSQDIVSTFGPGLLVTGNVVSTGTVQIFGRVVGDIHAARLLISKGAEVEGTVTTQETAIEGRFTGTIHSNAVKLLATAEVEGEIFKQSLVIEQNAQFEGVARRLTTPVEAPTAEHIKGQKPSPALAPIAQVVQQSQGHVNGNGVNGNGQFQDGAAN